MSASGRFVSRRYGPHGQAMGNRSRGVVSVFKATESPWLDRGVERLFMFEFTRVKGACLV